MRRAIRPGWGDVGTLHATGGPGGPQSFVAAGSLRRTATTDARGAVSFPGLPLGTYRLIALPTVGSSDGITVTAVDLVQDLSLPAVALAPKVIVSGRLLGAAPGTRLLILDDQPTLGHLFPAAALASDGGYSLSLDPAHAYHLVTNPPTGRMLARVALGPLETGSAALPMALGDRTLPAMLPVTGRVFGPDGQTAVAGALMQLFCMGAGPDCVDYSQLDAGRPLPLFEATTDAAGAFTLFVPDPAAP